MLSPNLTFISSVIKHSGYFDEEILQKVNNRYYIYPTEFNNALNELSTKKTLHALKYIFSVISPLRTL